MAKKPQLPEKIKMSKDNRNPWDSPPIGGFDDLQSLASMFEERKFYRDKCFKDFIRGEDNLIDFWNTKNLYGKTNKQGFPIYAAESYLKPFTSAPETDEIFGLGFVVDAFEGMVEDANMQARSGLGTIDIQNGIIFPLEVRRGWESAIVGYKEYMEATFVPFGNSYIWGSKERLKDISSMVQIFAEFVRDISGQVPLTFSSWVKSSICPANTNGIIVDLSDAPAQDDLSKWTLFLNDVNFETYRNLSEAHGFFIDKNIPWRLIANLNHPNMLKHQKNSGFFGDKDNLDSLFAQAYNLPHRQDIEFLKSYLATFYKAIQEKWGSVSLKKTIVCKNKPGRTITKTVSVDLEGSDAFYEDGSFNQESKYLKNLGDMFWLKLYYYMRSLEEGNMITFKQLDKQIVRFYDYYKLRDYMSTVDEINRSLLESNQGGFL